MTDQINFDNSDQVMNVLIENGELPQYIYKYTDITSLKLILENSTLKFSKPSDFNDPFDCNITIDTNNSTEEINDYIDSLKKGRNLSAEQINILKQQCHNPESLFELANKSIKQSKENFGVSCFSKLNDNILMWSHYSEKHKGVCLKFDLLEDSKFFMTPFVVKYNHEYPKFNYIRNHEGLAQFLLKTKSIDWNYEEEIRIMKEGHGFYEFKKNTLVEIIFGAKTSGSQKSEVMALIDKFKYIKTQIRNARISETEFKLEIE